MPCALTQKPSSASRSTKPKNAANVAVGDNRQVVGIVKELSASLPRRAQYKRHDEARTLTAVVLNQDVR